VARLSNPSLERRPPEAGRLWLAAGSQAHCRAAGQSRPRSVDMYNDWFMNFAPQAFRSTRSQATKDVVGALHATANLTNIQPAMLRRHPEILPTLRMSTCPPLRNR
jgi:hypothetical protein